MVAVPYLEMVATTSGGDDNTAATKHHRKRVAKAARRAEHAIMSGSTRRSFARALQRFRRGRRGATAVEFALVIVPFLALVGWIIELGLTGFNAFVLTGAAEEAGRLIRTGQVRPSDADREDTFRDEACDQTFGLIDCDEIVYTVKTFPNFGCADYFYQNYRLVRRPDDEGNWVWERQCNAGSCNPPDGCDDMGNRVEPGITMGGPSAITVVRVAFRREFLGPAGALFIGGDMEGLTLTASTAFRNAPYREDED